MPFDNAHLSNLDNHMLPLVHDPCTHISTNQNMTPYHLQPLKP